VADALQLGLDISGADHVAVREMPEIELHARLVEPFERQLVDGRGALAAIHGRGVVPGRVDVGAVVGRDLALLGGPAFAAGEAVGRHAGEMPQHAGN
jgi:hypothetical protein